MNFATFCGLIFNDKIRAITTYDMFDANLGITLGGVHYEYLIFAPNTEIRMSLNNPNSTHWQVWQKEIWELGNELSQKSGKQEFKLFFE